MEYAEIFVLFIVSSLYFLLVLLTCRLLWLCKKYVVEDPMENFCIEDPMENVCIEKDLKPSIITSDKASSLAVTKKSSASGFSTENPQMNMKVEQVKRCEN